MQLGHIIANDNEEFLAYSRITKQAQVCAWTSVPDLAQVFPSKLEADNTVKALDVSTKLWVLQLFETADNYLIGTPSDDRPSWL